MPQKYFTVGRWMMICGMPNVGKSTIINELRQISPDLQNKSARAVSKARPCTTKNLQGIPIVNTEESKIFLVDSPGVMSPHIQDHDTALKLSLIGCIKEVISEKEPIVDYLVYALNK